MAGMIPSGALSLPFPSRTIIEVKCGDTGGLVRAMAHANPVAEISLNTDGIAGCTYFLSQAYNPGHNPFTDTYTGLPPVTTTMLINGNGSTITRNSGSLFRILQIDSQGSLIIRGVTISGGLVCPIYRPTYCNFYGPSPPHDGGGIRNAGRLTMINCKVTNNEAAEGGGIVNDGIGAAATLINTGVYGNVTTYHGGGIVNNGTMKLINSRVLANTGALYGGGIANYLELTLIDSTVRGNSGYSGNFDFYRNGDDRGGGIWTVSSMTLIRTIVRSNAAVNPPYRAATGEGGGIFAGLGTMVITLLDSKITGNKSDYGGGIYFEPGGPGGVLTLTGGSVLYNHAFVGGGGIYKVNGTAVATAVAFRGNTPNNCAPAGRVIGCP